MAEKCSWSRSKSLQERRRGAEKKGFFLVKTLERCWSLGRRRPRPTAPPGCFVVLVGPERERFAVRAERANHPSFRALLDEAEAEYGFPRPAAEPLVLPCGASEFLRVMSEVERDEDDVAVARRGCWFSTSVVAGVEVLLERRCPCRFPEDDRILADHRAAGEQCGRLLQIK